MPGVHADLSPSGAPGWMRCAGWLPGKGSSKFAEEGTAAHTLAADVLINGGYCIDRGGDVIPVYDDSTPPKVLSEWPVNDEMIFHVQRYVDIVRSFGGFGAYEQRLSIEYLTREPGAKGTSDTIAIPGAGHIELPEWVNLPPDLMAWDATGELLVADLKYGKGVQVFAPANEQLLMYGAPALRAFSLAQDFKRLRLMIIQPRLNHVDHAAYSLDEVAEFEKSAARAAAACRYQQAGPESAIQYRPSKKACQWCDRKMRCIGLAEHIADSVGLTFDDLTASAGFEDLTGGLI